MSGIFGIFRRDGVPVNHESLKKMQDAMAYWGPDGNGIWQSGPLGLGHLALNSTPESIHDRQPLHSDDNRQVLVASARLDNREDLFSLFKLQQSLKNKTPDSLLVLEAFQKWGKDCVNQLYGDWSFALWDKRRKELVVARDHNGISGIYYYFDERFFAFASSIKGLLALKEVPRQLNEYRLAQILVTYPDPRVKNCSQLYANIRGLPPSHCLAVTVDRLDINEYWRIEGTPKIQLGSDEEYVEAFLEKYRQAVQCRLRSRRKVGISLSSGLDSGSVTALAGRMGLNDNRHLIAFTSVPVFDTKSIFKDTRTGDEWPQAHAVVEMLENVDHHAVSAKNFSPLQGIERFLKLHSQAAHAAANYYWIFAMYELAQKLGVGAMLSGQRGNATVSYKGVKYPSMAEFLSGNFADGWRSLREWKDTHRRSWAGVIKSQVLGPFVPYTKYIGTYFHQINEPWVDYSAINPAFARRLNIQPHVRQSQKEAALRMLRDPEAEHLAIYGAARTWIGALAQGNGAGYGLDVRDPTIDQRLLEFCFSIPVKQYNQGGEDRWLIRRAMEGLMPRRVLFNPKRGLQAADVALRTIAEPTEMESTLMRLESSEIVGDYLNLPKMRQVWDSIQQSVNIKNTRLCGSVLLRGVMAGLFLLEFNGEMGS